MPGFEASGVVVAGEGAYARWLVGKRVACGVQQKGDGTWAQYVLVDAMMCLPLLKRVSLEQGAMLLVNPFTAWGLVERARQGEHRAVVQSAAASALGRMVLKLGQRFKLPMVHVVRRDEQVELLRGLGAEHVLNSSDADFDDELKEVCHSPRRNVSLSTRWRATCRRDSSMRCRVAARSWFTAHLSEEPVRLDPRGLIFEDQRIEGFWLSDYLGEPSVTQLPLAHRARAARFSDRFAGGYSRTLYLRKRSRRHPRLRAAHDGGEDFACTK